MTKTMLANLAFEVHRETLLIVLKHGPGKPSQVEWESYLSALRPISERLEEMRIVVFTDGGRPRLEQQKQLNEFSRGRSVRTAVVSSNMAVRFVIAMFALVNSGIQGFDSKQRARAFSYLGLTAAECKLVELAERRLCLTFGLASQQAT
jgi:hypothetical protein